MHTIECKLVTILAEHILEGELVREIQALGARGYSISEARGHGSRGVNASEWQGLNVRIETLVPEDVANRILERLAVHYFPTYAVIAYLETVHVVRGDKFI